MAMDLPIVAREAEFCVTFPVKFTLPVKVPPVDGMKLDTARDPMTWTVISSADEAAEPSVTVEDAG